jgi:hypothetical protein
VISAQLEETLKSVADIEKQLENLTPGSRLYSFIAARAASSDYTSQLGVVSTIRRDFDQLADLMASWRRARDAGERSDSAPRPIDRIVLYIDDLDRCEPDQVLAVLHAVNLLVATDLFIVVVGVDPRWLLRSLRRRYRTMLGPAGSHDAGLSFRESSPQDYLEKIFQVPFVLPGFGADDLGRLLRSMVVPEQPPKPGVERPDHRSILAGDTRDPEHVVIETGEAERVERREAAALTVEATSQVAASYEGIAAPAAIARDVTDEELAILSRLHPLIRTPRAAKRLFNIYRLLRSTRDLRPAARFLGSDGQPGEYQAVAILLGVLTAYPDLLGTMLWGRRADGSDEPRALCRGGGSDRWRRFVSGLRPRKTSLGWENDVTDLIDDSTRADWADLVDALESVLGTEQTPFVVALDDIGPYQLWGPRVARFSFILSAFAADELEPVGAEGGGA